MKKLGFYLGFPIIIGLVSLWIHPRPALWAAPTNPWQLTLSEVERLGTTTIWVDARNMESFQVATIPGAIHVGMNSFEEDVARLFALWTPEAAVVVFCDQQYCDTSETVAQRLRDEFGMNEVYVLKGGWPEWISRNSR
jgi:3-mercaptopyruvate sulfurtransferase SseA